MTVTANKDKIGGKKVGRQSGGRLTSRGGIVMGRRWSESRHVVAEVIKKMAGGECRWSQGQRGGNDQEEQEACHKRPQQGWRSRRRGEWSEDRGVLGAVEKTRKESWGGPAGHP